MKRVAMIALLALAGCGGSDAPADRAAAPAATMPPIEPRATIACHPPRVRHTPYPGGDQRLSGIPWVRGEPRSSGLVGLLWYWREEWGASTDARVFTGGVAPDGMSAKVLWAFLDPSARDRGGPALVVEARNLDAPGEWRETFAAISYDGQEGAPSYASIIDLPSPGCWRLSLRTGGLEAQVDLQAVRLSPWRPTPAGR
jgi:hypothetical protein